MIKRWEGCIWLKLSTPSRWEEILDYSIKYHIIIYIIIITIIIIYWVKVVKAPSQPNIFEIVRQLCSLNQKSPITKVGRNVWQTYIVGQ